MLFGVTSTFQPALVRANLINPLAARTLSTFREPRSTYQDKVECELPRESIHTSGNTSLMAFAMPANPAVSDKLGYLIQVDEAYLTSLEGICPIKRVTLALETFIHPFSVLSVSVY